MITTFISGIVLKNIIIIIIITIISKTTVVTPMLPSHYATHGPVSSQGSEELQGLHLKIPSLVRRPLTKAG